MDYDRRQIGISYNIIENGTQILKYFSAMELFFCIVSILEHYSYVVYTMILFSYIGNNGCRFLNMTYLKLYSIYLSCSSLYYLIVFYIDTENECIYCIFAAIIHFFMLYLTISVRLECKRLKILLRIMSQQE